MTDPADPSKITPIPDISFSEILGLLEVLKRIGGKEDIYKLAAELKMEFGATLGVIRAAELLKLVHTPDGDVILEPLGAKVTRAKIHERKEIIRQELEKMPIIKRVQDFLEGRDNKEAARAEVEAYLAELVPNEDAAVSFNNLVAWARYADIFAYNDDTQTLFIDMGEGEED